MGWNERGFSNNVEKKCFVWNLSKYGWNGGGGGRLAKKATETSTEQQHKKKRPRDFSLLLLCCFHNLSSLCSLARDCDSHGYWFLFSFSFPHAFLATRIDDIWDSISSEFLSLFFASISFFDFVSLLIFFTRSERMPFRHRRRRPRSEPYTIQVNSGESKTTNNNKLWIFLPIFIRSWKFLKVFQVARLIKNEKKDNKHENKNKILCFRGLEVEVKSWNVFSVLNYTTTEAQWRTQKLTIKYFLWFVSSAAVARSTEADIDYSKIIFYWKLISKELEDFSTFNDILRLM